MKAGPALKLEDRQAQQFFADLRRLVPAYVPGWLPADGEPGTALLRIYARYLEALAEPMNRAPEKNKLAFLDQLGASLIPAQAARAAVVFQPLPAARDGRVTAGTRVGARVQDRPDPIPFETESDIALVQARLAELVTVWPGRDAYADHTQDVIGRQPFTLFDPLEAVAHELYLMHDSSLALSGQSEVHLLVDLGVPSSRPLKAAWEYWDGQAWRPFKDFAPTDVQGQSYDGTLGFQRSGTIRLTADCAETRTTKINGLEGYWLRARLLAPFSPQPVSDVPQVTRIQVQTVVNRSLPGGGVLPDAAFADSQKLDLTKTFKPLGANPQPGSAFYLACEEAFHRPGALVTVRFQRGESASDEADAKGKAFEDAVQQAKTLLQHAETDVGSAKNALDGIVNQGLIDPPAPPPPPDPLALAVWLLAWFPGHLTRDANALTAVKTARDDVGAASGLLAALDALGPIAAGGLVTPTLTLPVLSWEYWDGALWQPLLALQPSDPNNLPGPNDGYNFLGDGTVTFTAPEHWEATTVNGREAHWLRVRLVEGYFARMRIVSWMDKDGHVNYMPMVEPRSPVLDGMSIGYVYRSPKDPPQACRSYSDFEWIDHAHGGNGRAAAFAPFRPVRDTTPTVYFGFDRALPADLIGILIDVEEVSGRQEGPPLKWEFWNGSSWLPVRVADETKGLALPGILSVTWPGTDPLPSAAVTQNRDTLIQVLDRTAAAQFRPGNQLYLRKGEDGELAVLAQVSGPQLTTLVPVSGSYAGGIVSLAALPRFGTPRVWLRARLAFDGQPPQCRVNSVDLNAVWASQRSTLRDEVLGSGNAQPRQVHFTRESPVLEGQEIEVRELDGARAAVELPILRRTLLAQGLSDDDIRTDTDSTTGKVNAVWVRWRPRPHLLFSGPEDRHYVVDRSQGRILFGDGAHGMVLPAGANNLRARIYRSGGGSVGNIPAAAIRQILSGVLAQSVSNPRRAEGGAEGETLEAASRRGPQTLRHHFQAISRADYEWLARQASPAVAVARALSDTFPDGRRAKGWVKLIVIPQSQEPRPQPTFELRREVAAYLARRVPATVSGRIFVTGPDYFPVSVDVEVAPRAMSQGGPVLESVLQTLQAFLHPLSGGPDGAGWPFGRAVYLSDVAAALEALPGVDYIQTLVLRLEGTPQGDVAPVPQGRVVAAGLIRASLAGGEG